MYYDKMRRNINFERKRILIFTNTSFWSQVDPNTWVTSIGTLLGSLIGALLGALGALFAVKKQLEAEKENKNSLYMKKYFLMSDKIESVLSKFEKLYDDYWNCEQNSKNLPMLTLLLDNVIKQCNDILHDQIPLEKFYSHYKLYDTLINLDIYLLAYQENELTKERKQNLKEEINKLRKIHNEIVRESGYDLPETE